MAALPILSSPFNAFSCLCVQVADNSPEFPLVIGLPSRASAMAWETRRFVRLLLWYYADVRLLSCVHVRLPVSDLPLPSRHLLAAGAAELSRFSNIECPRMHRVSDSAGPDNDSLFICRCLCCLPFRRTRSAPQTGDFGAQWLAYASPVNASRAASRPPAHDLGP